MPPNIGRRAFAACLYRFFVTRLEQRFSKFIERAIENTVVVCIVKIFDIKVDWSLGCGQSVQLFQKTWTVYFVATVCTFAHIVVREMVIPKQENQRHII
jgi:hypothetical protein